MNIKLEKLNGTQGADLRNPSQDKEMRLLLLLSAALTAAFGLKEVARD